jgi:hypothetical protein
LISGLIRAEFNGFLNLTKKGGARNQNPKKQKPWREPRSSLNISDIHESLISKYIAERIGLQEKSAFALRFFAA